MGKFYDNQAHEVNLPTCPKWANALRQGNKKLSNFTPNSH